MRLASLDTIDQYRICGVAFTVCLSAGFGLEAAVCFCVYGKFLCFSVINKSMWRFALAHSAIGNMEMKRYRRNVQLKNRWDLLVSVNSACVINVYSRKIMLCMVAAQASLLE